MSDIIGFDPREKRAMNTFKALLADTIELVDDILERCPERGGLTVLTTGQRTELTIQSDAMHDVLSK